MSSGDGEGSGEGKRIPVFLYGSNLDVDSLRKRCGVADGELEVMPAKALGWAVGFTLLGFPPLEPSFASLEKIENTSSTGEEGKYLTSLDGAVHGQICFMDETQYQSYWESEGGGKYFCAYNEIFVDVITYSGKKFEAVSLSSHPVYESPNRRFVRPSPRYIGAMIAGAKKANLDEKYIEKLRTVPAAAPFPQIVGKIARFSLNFYFLTNKLSRKTGIPFQSAGIKYNRHLVLPVMEFGQGDLGTFGMWLLTIALFLLVIPVAILGIPSIFGLKILAKFVSSERKHTDFLYDKLSKKKGN